MDEIVARLRAAGCVFAEDEARLLRDAPGDLDDLVARRVGGEPLESLLGWAEFRGLRIIVEPGVFVPRQRTAFLVEQALPHARPGGIAVDLCCGTGAIGAALAAAVPGLVVHAADVDPAAVACARRNLPRVHLGDLYDALPSDLRGHVDVLAVNAPYVPTAAIATMPPEARDHEPQVALDGGTDGVDVQRRVAAGAPHWLSPTGVLLVETSEAQAATTAAACGAAGLAARVERDAERDATVVVGRRSSRHRGEDLLRAMAGVVDDEDPEGLLAGGAPPGEYGPEIAQLAGLVQRGAATDDAVLAVWEHWFGPGSALARSPDRLRRLAARLRELHPVR